MSTIYIPDNYDTIQAAVTAALPGDKIIVKDKTGGYNEQVSINKSKLHIVAYNADVFLDGSGLSNPTAFHVNGCNNVTIEGFKIQNYEEGIKSTNSSNTIVHKCNLSDITTAGINIDGTSSNNTITKCEFITSSGYAIVIENISVAIPSNGCNDITKNIINGLNGIKITNSHINRLICNEISGNDIIGISLENANNNEMTRNIIEGAAGYAAQAVSIKNSDNNIFSRNMIKVDIDTGSIPINIVDSNGTTLSNNTIEES